MPEPEELQSPTPETLLESELKEDVLESPEQDMPETADELVRVISKESDELINKGEESLASGLKSLEGLAQEAREGAELLKPVQEEIEAVAGVAAAEMEVSKPKKLAKIGQELFDIYKDADGSEEVKTAIKESMRVVDKFFEGKQTVDKNDLAGLKATLEAEGSPLWGLKGTEKEKEVLKLLSQEVIRRKIF